MYIGDFLENPQVQGEWLYQDGSSVNVYTSCSIFLEIFGQLYWRNKTYIPLIQIPKLWLLFYLCCTVVTRFLYFSFKGSFIYYHLLFVCLDVFLIIGSLRLFYYLLLMGHNLQEDRRFVINGQIGSVIGYFIHGKYRCKMYSELGTDISDTPQYAPTVPRLYLDEGVCKQTRVKWEDQTCNFKCQCDYNRSYGPILLVDGERCWICCNMCVRLNQYPPLTLTYLLSFNSSVSVSLQFLNESRCSGHLSFSVLNSGPSDWSLGWEIGESIRTKVWFNRKIM